MAEIAQWAVFETALESTGDYANPFWDVTLQVHFVAPSGTNSAARLKQSSRRALQPDRAKQGKTPQATLPENIV